MIREFGSGAGRFRDGARRADFLFALVISYTETCKIPGITFAGADPGLFKYTPPADAEFLHFGYCKSIKGIPVTPDGRPTPALLTKAALEHASIPHMVIDAGSAVSPQLPYVHTGLPPGRNIARGHAMSEEDLLKAVDYGRIIGRTLASVTDCLIIGESIPAGTTTALALMRGFGIDARVSSSMPENPTELKTMVVEAALKRVTSRDPFVAAAALGDPMIPVAAGMINAASEISMVMLAGGTQMAAVLTFARSLGFNRENVAVGTTSYVVDDETANMVEIVTRVAGVPILAVDPGLGGSEIPGLRGFSQGYAKEGVGAGGSIIASMLKTGSGAAEISGAIEAEYSRITSR